MSGAEPGGGRVELSAVLEGLRSELELAWEQGRGRQVVNRPGWRPSHGAQGCDSG